MTTTRSSRAATAAAAFALLALAGCSSSGGGGATPGSADSEPGPLDAYMARIYGYSLDDDRTDAELEAESDRQNRRVEELVAACMQDEGFDYTPAETSGGTVSADDLDVEWGTREFAEQYGYGISTDPWASPDDAEADEWVDPNQEYIEQMSEGELAAWSEALHGPSVEGDVDQEYDWTTAGCYGAAQHEVYEGGVESDQFAGIEAELERFSEASGSDPRVVALDQAWSSCMADEGYGDLPGAYAAQDELYTEYNTLQGWDDPEYAASSESWDWEAEPEGPPAPEVDEAALAAFTEKEISQAVADVECQERVDFVAERTRIDHELQQAFVDQHADELEAWATAATAARGQ
jgi:hypothetical protein